MSKIALWKDLVQTSFRQEYVFPVKAAQNWFPGHMHKGLKEMQRRVKDVDCVIEVHDARIPFSGRNTSFKESISGARPHILVLNKKDLIPEGSKSNLIKRIKEEDPLISEVLFTDAKANECQGMKLLLPKAIRLIENSNRYHRTGLPEKTIIIIGIPNVGKSTVINRLRNSHLRLGGRAAPVGATPGITRAVQEKIRVSNKPLVYLMDTPGISKPNVRNMHVGMKLAICNTLNDLVVGELYICDYLLWHLNSHHHFDYVEHMGLKEPEDNHLVMLAKSAIAAGKFKRVTNLGVEQTLPNIEVMGQKFLKAFRTGTFGRISLDEDLLGIDNVNKKQNFQHWNLSDMNKTMKKQVKS